jgi:thiamine-phosphate pyrophosphorylase
VTQLCVITDFEIQDCYSHIELAELAIRGGANVIQLRDKKMKTAEFIGVALAMRTLCKEAGVSFIVNDRVDIALLSDADGVHLGQHDLPIPEARKILGSHKIIGGTAGNLEQTLTLEQQGANYIGYGHIFPTSTKLKNSEPKGIEELKMICQTVKIPVFAIGGIDQFNVASVLEAKPAGVAVVQAVAGARDPYEATHQLRNILDHSLSEAVLRTVIPAQAGIHA